jgi:hypothetical protein
MAEDPLHRRRVRARHHQQRRRGVAEVVEPDGPHLARGPELHAALRAAAQLGIGRAFGVAAALAPALVDVELDDAGAMKRPAQDPL